MSEDSVGRPRAISDWGFSENIVVLPKEQPMPNDSEDNLPALKTKSVDADGLKTSAATWNFKALMCEFDAILERDAGESLGEDNIDLIADFLRRKFEAATPSVETEGKK